MKAKVKALLQDKHHGKDRDTMIGGKSVKVGDSVDVDENTFRNLFHKGVLEAADAESKAVDLEVPSQLTEADAERNVESTIAAREVAAEKSKRAAKRVSPKKK